MKMDNRTAARYVCSLLGDKEIYKTIDNKFFYLKSGEKISVKTDFDKYIVFFQPPSPVKKSKERARFVFSVNTGDVLEFKVTLNNRTYKGKRTPNKTYKCSIEQKSKIVYKNFPNWRSLTENLSVWRFRNL